MFKIKEQEHSLAHAASLNFPSRKICPQVSNNPYNRINKDDVGVVKKPV